MAQERHLSELSLRDGHVISRPAWAHDIMYVLTQIVQNCALPAPFARGTCAKMRHRSARTEDFSQALPVILWQVSRFSRSNDRPVRVYTGDVHVSSQSMISLYQQEMEHLVEFSCVAATDEEADRLMAWLADTIYLYKAALADAGCVHISLLDGGSDTLTASGDERYPTRIIRFGLQTALLFRAARGPLLKRLDIRVSDGMHPQVIVDEAVTRGVDTLAHEFVVGILEVTSGDKRVLYDPVYDATTRSLVWPTDRLQPDAGATYLVTYFAYGEEALTMSVTDVE
jgi:hypothetical protein